MRARAATTDHDLRKDASMQLDLRVALALANDRQARERELAALRRRRLDPARPAVPARTRLGLAVVRFGRWLAGDPTTPAWTA